MGNRSCEPQGTSRDRYRQHWGGFLWSVCLL
nr:MAG TPA: hypothetical protein [Bacteriophage sp.]